ncbi:MAG TPA: hypothetical protein VKY59_21860 [Spirillospora sp.]|nr:hypothetical protein [Spirillospora sp.]
MRRLFFALACVNIAFVVLHLATQPLAWSFVAWLFDLNFEHNLSATYSALLLLATGFVSLTLALRLRNKPHALYWLMWGLLFLFLAYDETYMVHERIENWILIYAAAGVVIAGIAGVTAWFFDRQHIWLYALSLAGVGVMAAGGLVLERFYETLPRILVVEELWEFIGASLTLSAALAYARQYAEAAQWRRMGRNLLIVCALWVVVMVASAFWPLPALEARLIAQPAATSYLDGALELVAYQVEREVIRPGQPVNATFYWRANASLDAPYALTLRLLEQPTGRPLAAAEIPLGEPTLPPTNTWPTGMIFRKELLLPTVGVELAAPASYWLVVNVWKQPWQPDHMLDVARTDRELLLPDTFILSDMTVLPDEAPPAPPQVADYRFDNQISLVGYDLPSRAEGRRLRLGFWWQTEADVEQNLTQMLHLRHVETDTYFFYDQPPFRGTFPTENWPAGLLAADRWELDLDASLPAGQYEIYTGLYHFATLERIPVTNAGGEPLSDDRIRLGVFTLEASS